MLESITTPEVSNINETEVANKEQIDPSNEKKFLTYDYSSKYSEIRVPVLPSVNFLSLFHVLVGTSSTAVDASL
jgi:hypothetical protein